MTSGKSVQTTRPGFVQVLEILESAWNLGVLFSWVRREKKLEYSNSTAFLSRIYHTLTVLSLVKHWSTITAV